MDSSIVIDVVTGVGVSSGTPTKEDTGELTGLVGVAGIGNMVGRSVAVRGRTGRVI